MVSRGIRKPNNSHRGKSQNKKGVVVVAVVALVAAAGIVSWCNLDLLLLLLHLLIGQQVQRIFSWPETNEVVPVGSPGCAHPCTCCTRLGQCIS